METIFWMVALSLPIIPNLWCIWHASRHDFPNPNERVLWIRTGTFAPIIGGVLYLTVGMRRARPIQNKEGSSPSGPKGKTGQDVSDQ